ncbi:MAG: 1-deoxy-D-xylulose-5-phosphate synthase [Bacteroidales bacterium]|nr:1-deoxy-D-xylulose-5-phosphate synthase [Bacteroidales bacterium]
MKPEPGPLLASINSPHDLRKLDKSQLNELCNELRNFILDVVSVHPGHLGSSLGAVELTVALHYVYNTPNDKLIWDVGHQAYGHKILTGRRDLFHTNRQYKGISGFPSRAESEFDAFGVGHASTSVSAALGMAVASKLTGKNGKKHIAVIGDGAMTGGLALEGMNNAGVSNADILVVLNDNGISIDKNVGAIKEYLTLMATSRTYNKFKNAVWDFLGKASRYGPNTQRFAQRIENAIKGTILRRSNLFEAMNFRYFGPVDGHDVEKLVRILSDIREIGGPKILHVITTKGKGFKRAEEEQTIYHAPGLFNRETGDLIHGSGESVFLTYQQVFGRTLLYLAQQDDKIVAITPAMPSGSALNFMMDVFPDRVFDVGIAEEHAVTFAAGMAAEGLIPFCTIYSTFLQRAYDQIIHDVALQNLPVVFCIDRAGLVGEDGATHHGVFDLAYMSGIPNMVVSAPMDEVALRNLMFTAAHYQKGPFSIRYPRKRGVVKEWEHPLKKVEIGKGRSLRSGKYVAVLSIGDVGNTVKLVCDQLAQEGILVGHFDMQFLQPIDEALLQEVFAQYQSIVTIEDGAVKGGLGDAVLRFKNKQGYAGVVTHMGIPEKFIEHGSLADLYDACGISAPGIKDTVQMLYLVNSSKEAEKK